MDNKKHWIQNAVKNPGSFTAKAKRAGISVQKYAHLKEHAKGKLGKQARLDLVFAKLRGNN